MVDRIHVFSENMRFLSKPSLSSGFSDNDILMLVVSKLSDSGVTVFVEFSHFSGRQFDEYDLKQIILTDYACV